MFQKKEQKENCGIGMHDTKLSLGWVTILVR